MIIFFSFFLGLAIMHDVSMRSYHPSIGVGVQDVRIIDESLKPYINVTGGSEGYSSSFEGWHVCSGDISWIGSPQDSIRSISGIHLLMYTKVDDRTYIENGTILTHVHLGAYLEASRNKIEIPADVIDYSETVIPMIGLDVPTCQYSLNCSTTISQEDADGFNNFNENPLMIGN